MTRPAISAAATAILGALPAEKSFPTIGIIRQIVVSRVFPGVDPSVPGVVTNIDTFVMLNDRDELAKVMWGGGLAAEIEQAIRYGLAPASFVGREVKVELIDGRLIAAYTVNGTIE